MLGSTANIILPHGATYPLIYSYIHNLTSDQYNWVIHLRRSGFMTIHTGMLYYILKAVTRVCMNLYVCTV